MSKEKGKGPKEANVKDKFDFVSDMSEKLVDIYEATLAILEEGIKAGKANPMLGYMSLLIYADLLHGGAYTRPLSQQPFYTQEGDNYFIDIPPAQGIGPPERVQIQFPAGASSAQKEIIVNSDVPHIFPKLITDQTAFVLKDFTDRIFTVDTINIFLQQLTSTGLKTLVEAGKKGRSIRGATAAAALRTEAEL